MNTSNTKDGQYVAVFQYKTKSVNDHGAITAEILAGVKAQISGLESILGAKGDRSILEIKARDESWHHDGEQFNSYSGVSHYIDVKIISEKHEEFVGLSQFVLKYMGMPSEVYASSEPGTNIIVLLEKKVFEPKGYVLKYTDRNKYSPRLIKDIEDSRKSKIAEHKRAIAELEDTGNKHSKSDDEVKNFLRNKKK